MKPLVGERIFVYGTLRPECRAYDLLKGRTTLIGSGTLQGAELYNLGSFPGLKISDDPTKVVHGVILEINDDKLPDRLDQYEGYPVLYDRQVVETSHGPAWVYVFNRDVDVHKRIESGDWLKLG